MPHKVEFDYSKNEGLPEVVLRVELLRRRLKKLSNGKDSRILEVGVGSGDITAMLAKNFSYVTCVDPNKKNCNSLIKQLEAKDLNKVKFVYTKVEDIKFSSAGYSHIILQNILEHLKDPINILRKLSIYLKQDGYMHICVPLANSLHRWLGVELGLIAHINDLSEVDIQYGHRRVYTPDLLREHIGLAGLQLTYEENFYLKPLPTSMLTHLPAKIHNGLYSLGHRFPEFASYIYVEATNS